MGNVLDLTAKTVFDELGQLYFDVTCREDDRVSRKRLRPEEFFGLFDESKDSDSEDMIQILRLPDSVICAAQGINQVNTFDAVLFFPAEKRLFSLFGEICRIPFPGIVAKVSVRKGVRTETLVFATDTNSITDNSPLYLYPFGNVSVCGDPCFGNISTGVLKDVTYAPLIMELFFAGDTNDDYWTPIKVNHAAKTQREVVENLKKLETYPCEWLMKDSMNRRIRDLKEGIAG